ncbi:MAG: hypothetical protein AABW54_03170 [Candidatus Micrarchaeota archaeon]
MSESLTKLYHEASRLKSVLLENNNIGVLLYLAKYNPQVTRRDLKEKFGKDALKGLENLKRLELIDENDEKLTLTHQGIFQVEGLMALA